MLPLVKIHGGGYYNKQFVISHFPTKYEDLTYLETCIGGGSIGLNKKPSVSEVWADVDPHLISIYNEVKTNVTEFFRDIRSIKYRKESFDEALIGLYSLAVNEYVLRRMSRGGMMKSFSWSDRLRGKANPKPGDVNAWLNSILNLEKISKRLEKVELACLTIEDSIRRYDPEFVYIDPPFLDMTRKSNNVYRYEMTFTQHENMLKFLVDEKRQFLLAGYQSDLYRDYLELRGWKRFDKPLTNHSSQSKKKSVKILSLWRNY